MVDTLEFYDVKAKKKFKSNKYTVKVKNGRRFAVVAKSPLSGIAAWRILGLAKTAKKTTKTSTKKKVVKKK